MAYRYAVLGGGVLGLTTALRLAQQGHAVTVFEREPLAGGLAAGFRVNAPPSEQAVVAAGADEVWLDKFYHHIFKSDRAIIGLIEELGLGDQLDWRRPLTVTLRGGKVHQLDSPSSVLRFTPLSLAARLRLGAVLAYLRLLPSPKALEGKTAAAWLRRTMGRSAYETVWAPLLKGKFGALADQIALPWFWARVHDRTAQLGYVHGGFQRLYNRLAERIGEQGGSVLLGTNVQSVARDDGAGEGAGDWTVRYASVATPDAVQSQTFDRVVSTLPTRLTCRLVAELPADYRAKYEWGTAYGAHCLILSLDRQVTNSYWMNVNDPGYPFMVYVEHTNYMPKADYDGQTLVYLGNYRPMDDPLFQASKEQVLADFLPQVQRINPAFRPEWVRRSWMFSAPFAQPIVTNDYRQHIPPLDTPLAGLYVANMFQVYPHDRGQNYSVELAERLVKHLR
ncbi:MAG: NAD(P)/FAD-dependent oxidoreductase [Ktedonobacterales bacterium]